MQIAGTVKGGGLVPDSLIFEVHLPLLRFSLVESLNSLLLPPPFFISNTNSHSYAAHS